MGLMYGPTRIRPDCGPELQFGADGHGLVHRRLRAAVSAASAADANARPGLAEEGDLVLQLAGGLLHHARDPGGRRPGKSNAP